MSIIIIFLHTHTYCLLCSFQSINIWTSIRLDTFGLVIFVQKFVCVLLYKKKSHMHLGLQEDN